MKKNCFPKLPLIVYDLLIFLLTFATIFLFYRGSTHLTQEDIIWHLGVSLVLVFGVRHFGKIYRQIWRYGGIQCYIRLLLCDYASMVMYILAEKLYLANHGSGVVAVLASV